MKDNIDYIIFAIKQAIAAEKFGFTRNECCRNLKTALHQYWQSNELKMNGQAHRSKIPRSKAALNKLLSECTVEHIVPQMFIVNILMDMKGITKIKVRNILKKYFHVMLVTKKEHEKLNASGLRSTMPEDWNCKDIYARYKAVGIKWT